MFNQKLKNRIRELETKLKESDDRAFGHYVKTKSLETHNGELVKQLRDMDQAAFSISQCTSFEAMRPHIQRMCDMAAQRQQAESSRIRNLMMTEIKATYGNNEQPLTAPPTPVEQKRLR